MVQINVSNGQGITQAIAKQAGLKQSDCKNISLSVWQQVMTEVKTANQEADNKFYTGGDDADKIGDKSSWKTDFKVMAGQVIELAQDVWDNIVSLLKTGKKAETAEQTQQTTTANATTADNGGKNTTEEVHIENKEEVANPVASDVPNHNASLKNSNQVLPKSQPDVSGQILNNEKQNTQTQLFTRDVAEEGTQTIVSQGDVSELTLPSEAERPKAPTFEEIMANSKQFEDQGYVTQIWQDGTNVFVKDGKVYERKDDGTLGKELKGLGFVEQKTSDGQTVSGIYKIDISGTKLNATSEFKITSMSQANIDLFGQANIDRDDYVKLITDNAIYNDLTKKQAAGIELSDAELKYIELYKAAIDKCNLSLDKNGNYVLKGPVKKTGDFPNAIKPQYNSNDEYASCTNLKKVLESYGFKVGREYSTGGGELGENVYELTSSDGTKQEFSSNPTPSQLSKFISKITTIPPQRYSL